MAKKIKMDKKEFIKEHKRLVRVLESKDKKDDKAEAKIQKEELKEYAKKAYKTKKCNNLKKMEAELIQSVQKAHDWQNAGVSIAEESQAAAEATAAPELVNYLRASWEAGLTRIPFQKGNLVLQERDNNLFQGVFYDRIGDTVEKFYDQTIEMVAKNMQVKGLYKINKPVAVKVAQDLKSSDIEDQMEEVAEEEVEEHNREMHGPQSESQGTALRLKVGDIELEIRKSIQDFIGDFKKAKVDKKGVIKKSISSWRKNLINNKFSNDAEAARELVNNWDQHSESFLQAVHAMQQLGESDNDS